MKTLTTTWTGKRPIIMHSAEMVDPLNPIVRRIRELTMKPSKKVTDAEREEIQRLEWEGSMYWDEELGFYIPSDNIEKCIKEGAQKSRLGKTVEAVVFATEDRIKIDCGKYPMDRQALYEMKRPDGKGSLYSIRKAVRIPPKTGARLMKVRAMIPTGWKLTVTLDYDETMMNVKDLIKAMIDGGAYIGLGDWRPKFGRFLVE